MKISELVEKLEEYKSKYGDLHVGIEDEGFGGRIVYEVDDNLDTDAIYISELLEEDFNNISNYFTQEEIENEDEDSMRDILVIRTGRKFYST